MQRGMAAEDAGEGWQLFTIQQLLLQLLSHWGHRDSIWVLDGVP